MLSTLLAVWFLYLGAMISPGPNILLVSQLAASRGRKTAWVAGLGVAFGAGVWASCAVLGIHALFLAFPSLRLTLQMVGALYLLYVAARLWRSGAQSTKSSIRKGGLWVAFQAGALTNLTNPKAALFFGSIFAASFPVQPTVALQLGAVAVVVLSAIAWYTLLAVIFSRSVVVQNYSRASVLIGRLASACFGIIGVSMLYKTVREARA